ncbi:MAG: heme o synthase [Pseudomonadota bacterium]
MTEASLSLAVPKWRDLFVMTKPTITLLVVITAIPGLLLGASSLPEYSLLLWTCLGAGLASSSAAVFNQVVEHKIDQTMQRTKKRGVASNRISRFEASVFGLVLGALGMGILYTQVNPLSAYVALSGHVFYVVVYTLILKKRTVQNIVIGGAAGSVGPLIGFAAASNSLPWEAWVMFALIFLWTPPHFWALALKYQNDYAAAGIPMYPVVHGDHKTRKVIYLYALTLVPVVGSFYLMTSVGFWGATISMLLTLKFSYDTWRLYRSGTNDLAMPVFHYSCLYTFLVFGIIAIERLIHLLPKVG